MVENLRIAYSQLIWVLMGMIGGNFEEELLFLELKTCVLTN